MAAGADLRLTGDVCFQMAVRKILLLSLLAKCASACAFTIKGADR